MHVDPHEPAGRRDVYAKDQHEEAMLVAVNAALQDAEIPAQRDPIDVERLPIVYIVGAPRSGTTLLSQLLSRYLPLGYINNLVARFWLRPSVGIRLSRTLMGGGERAGIMLHSTHGVSPGVTGPHEFGYFWRHWLQLDRSPTHHLTEAAQESIDTAGLKYALEEEILRPFAAGVIFKNVICGFHGRLLTRIHPASLFVHIKRDPYETAASILECRRERFGSYDAWWSLKPSTYPFGLETGDAAAAVAKQVLDCRTEMDAELARSGVKAMDVTYEDLCADPCAAVQTICRGLSEIGAKVDPVDTAFPTLTAAPATRLPSHLAARLHECLRQTALVNDSSGCLKEGS